MSSPRRTRAPLWLLFALSLGCGTSTEEPECVAFDGGCVPVQGAGDSLVQVGTSNNDPFYEVLALETVGKRQLVCSSVRGLTLFETAADGQIATVVHDGPLGEGAHPEVPRCQHLTVVAGTGDGPTDVFIASHGDEFQPTPWVKWVRYPEGVAAVEPTITAPAPVVATLLAASPDQAFEGLVHHGEHLYVATHTAGLTVLKPKASGDGAPVLERVATATLGGNLFDVAAFNGAVFNGAAFKGAALDGGLAVADRARGLVTLDVSDPEKPSVSGTASSSGTPVAIATAGHIAYLASGAGGLELFDLSDPASPQRLAAVPTRGTALDVAADGRWAVVANWSDLRLFDVSNPSAPWLAAAEVVPSASKPFSAVLGVALDGGRVWAGEWTAIHAYDIRADQTPPQIGVHRAELVFEGSGDTRALLVRNEGWRTLEVQAVPSAAELFAVSPTSLRVAPGGTEVLEVSATGALASGAVEALALLSNDPDEAITLVRLAAAEREGLGPGDTLPADWSMVDLATGQPVNLAERTQGKVVLLAYFATF